jgi:hypothetical protein
MLVSLFGSPRPWSPVGHRAAATREESERRGMTRGASASAIEREVRREQAGLVAGSG